jgi:hypothetical protein
MRAVRNFYFGSGGSAAACLDLTVMRKTLQRDEEFESPRLPPGNAE